MRLGRYEVEGEIGRGGMGVVLRARGPDGGAVAIKVITGATSADALARFEREKRLLLALGETEGFVPLIEAGASPRGPWFAMPLVAGGNLVQRLARGPLSVDESVAIAKAVARALGRAHAAGIVHRDVKPANVLFAPDGRPLVSDLGLARHFRLDALGASQSVALTRSGEKWGTLGYAAPEQIEDMRLTGPRSDVYATGVLLWECLAGRRLFDEPDLLGAIARMRAGAPPAKSIRPDVPPWIDRVLARALAFDPEQRFANGEELARALEEGPRRAAPSRARTVVALAIVAVVVGGAALALALARPATTSPAPRVEGPQPSAPPENVAKNVAKDVAKSPEKSDVPEWFRDLPAHERPPAPLPAGIRIGKTRLEYVNEKDGSVLVFVPGGTFTIGHAPEETGPNVDDSPAREVTVGPIFIGKLEVTHEQFASFVRETGYVTEPETRPCGWTITTDDGLHYARDAKATWRDPVPGRTTVDPRHPVTQVTPVDVERYLAWAGLRLPTEPEWERATGWDGRRVRPYAWGERPPSADSGAVANVPDARAKATFAGLRVFPAYDDGFALLAPVGSYPDGASAYGLLDAIGNALELCELDPDTTPAKERIARGGSWWQPTWFCTTRVRSHVFASEGRFDVGFRVARSAVGP